MLLAGAGCRDTRRVTNLERACAALAALLLATCDGPSAPDASTRDAPGSADAPSCSAPGPFAPVAGDGAADPLAAPAGEARAGRLEAAEVPEDPHGLSRVRAGDFVLANDRVAVVVSDLGPGELYDPYGGRVIGLARVEGGALHQPADYNLFLLGLGRFLVATDSVGVLSDGADGGPAVVRAVGPLAPIRALADLLDGVLPEDFTGVPAALDYELAPDAEHVDVFLSVRVGPAGARARLGAVQAFFQGYRMPPWAPSTGFDDRTGATPFVAFEDDDATSYAWMAAEGALNQLFGATGIDVVTGQRAVFAPCEEARLHVGRLVIGGPGLPGVQAAIARLDGTELRTLTGSVVEADGSPAEGVRVHVTAADGTHLTRFSPEADGTFRVPADARAASLWAWRAGEPMVGPIAVEDGARLTMGAFGTVRVTATDADGAPLPARVEIVPAAGAPAAPPDAFGEPVVGRGRSHVAFPPDGAVTLRVPPGTHRVTIGHGPEHERYETDVTVAAGEEAVVTASLARVVDTTGVMCADYHIHTHRSVDSSDLGLLKVAGLAADGLEIAIRSEHEWVSDFQPVVEALGLGDHVLGMAGLELTTFTWGHFGVFPLEPDPERASGGAVRWYDRLAPDVFDEVRAREEEPALIINHPRAGGVRQGYFNEAGFDPATGTASRPELWDDAFTVVEVFNGTDFERNRDGTVRDWMALLSLGRRVFAVGSSDSHVIYDNPVGYPRTCLRVGVDDPRALTPEMVRDATLSGRAVVSGGIYLDVTGPSGVGPGEEASGVGTSATVTVAVRAAEWVDVDRLEVFVDGASTETIPIAASAAALRAMVDVEVEVAAGGSYVIFHASGDDAVDANGNRPFAVSNPIFLTR